MLTPKQEKFVQNLVKGMSQREAYKNAYPDDTSTDKTIDENACRLFNDSKIKARYIELQDKATTIAVMTAAERKEWLTKVINGDITENNDKPTDVSTKIKALDTLNKMDGEYITKIEGDIGIKEIRVELDDE